MSSLDSTLRFQQPWSRKLYGYLALARISNSPTVVSDVLAGAALAGALAPSGALAALIAAMVLFYTAGMYLNDVCDYAIDCRERPERPLPTGLIARSAAMTVVVGLFGLGSGLLWGIGLAPFLSGVVLIGLIVVYDLWHKGNPVGPLLMAACRLMVYVTAFVAFSTHVTSALVISGGLLFGYLVGLTYIAKNENQPHFSRYWPAALLFLPAVYFAAQGGRPELLLVLVLFVLWVAHSISYIYRRRGRDIGAGVGRLIAGISLVDGLVLASVGAAFGLVVALLAFGTTWFFQRYIKGT